jgi:signal transduction histidine kinase
MKIRLKGSERALLITLSYAVIGLVWIYFSDRISLRWIDDPDAVYWMQLLKGSFYVLTTAVILYFLIQRQLKRVERYVHLLNSNNKLMNFILQKSDGLVVLVVERNGKMLNALGDSVLLEGLSIKELYGETLKSWLDDESGFDSLNLVLTNTFQNGSYSSDVEISGRWFRVKGNLFVDNEQMGTVACLQLTNITTLHELLELNIFLKEDRKKLTVEVQNVKNSLVLEKDKQALIFNGLFDSVLIHELDQRGRLGRLLDANVAASAMFNCQKSDLIKYGFYSFLSFENLKFSEVLQENNYFKTSSIVARAQLKPLKSQAVKNVEIRSHLVGTINHKYVLTVIRDLTEHIWEVNKLKNSGVISSLLLEQLNDGVLVIDRNLDCEISNRAVGQVVDLNAVDSSGDDIITQIRKKGVDLIPLVNMAFGGQEVMIPDKNLKVGEKWISIRIVPGRQSQGEIENVICVLNDISEQRLLELNVLDLTHRLEAGNKLISVFLSNLSHEIRTPMNGIVGFVELMEMEDLTSVQFNYMKLIRQSSQHLLMLVESIFEISRLQNKQEVINNSWFIPSTVIDELYDYTHALLETYNKKTIRLEKHVDEPSRVVMIYSDKEKLLSALKHICDNAVKFTHQGAITLSLNLYENDSAKFVVSDTGIGFDPRQGKSIFLPFITYNNNRDQIYDGLGLGLAISLAKIELLGGTIEVESQINSGANFFVSVPFKNSAVVIPMRENMLVGPWGKVKKVMVVQSGFESIDMYQQIFRPHGIEITLVYDGMSAIETFYEQQDVDLVLCDIRLADMEAYEVFKAIKRMNASTIIIAQTSYFLSDERQKCLDIGFAEYLVKPINASMIFGILVNLSVSTQ